MLDALQKMGQKHTISFIESGTGGRIAAAFTAVPGASRHLNQVLVPYSGNPSSIFWEHPANVIPP